MSNEAKFTKGPWFAHMDNQFFNEVGPKETIQTFVNVHANKILDMGQEECDANTHLIAAAPEMYEILSAISDCIELGQTDALNAFDIEKLLAKARGE